ncbi:uncharacterized protein METZ01_LOCUS149394 [marine metagenome]|jgi:hypothetical protein|uniref:Uncharacterized protein n=1 Tax=marine metagenome TaxID=408172 RepID=A0A382A4S7_9ZZZZ|tara:strand:- start:1182 stop:1385 length:204 start_codon:yes stop_codon:yes gene_type:complete
MLKRVALASLFIANLIALPLQVGDTCPDFSVPICANGSGDFELYANANGAENGGEYHAVWIDIFASW